MSASDISYMQMLTNITAYIYRYGNLLIYILGNIGNLLSICVFFKKSWSKNVCVFYFKFCLFLTSAYLNSALLGSIFINGFNINLQTSNIVLCKLFQYISLVLVVLLPTVLVLASIDRLLISSQNVDTRLYSSKRLAYFSISISTIFWIVFNIHALVKVYNIEIYSSIVICYYDFSGWYINFVFYTIICLNWLFCVLMIILSVLSLKNVRHIRSIPREKRDRIRSMTKKDFQLLRCLFVHDVVYIAANILPSAFSLYAMIIKDQKRTFVRQALEVFVNDIITFCYTTFYCTSFFIFFTLSKAFRHELKRMIYKLFGRDLVPLREEDQRQINVGMRSIEANVAVVNTIEALVR